MTLGLKSTRNIGKDNVEEEESEDGGENTGFRMETRKEERRLTDVVISEILYVPFETLLLIELEGTSLHITRFPIQSLPN